MTMLFTVYDRIELLPFFLRYYTRMGITRFCLGLYNGAKHPLYDKILQFQKTYDLQIRTSIACAVEDYDGTKEAPGLNLMREEFVPPEDWYAIADLDEFIRPVEPASLPEVCAQAQAKGYPAVHGCLLDRVAADGQFPEIRPDIPLDDQFPLACEITRHRGSLNKIGLARGDVPILGGHHRTPLEKRWEHHLEVHHFKWTAGLLQRLRERSIHLQKQGLEWGAESAYFLGLLQGGVDVKNPIFQARPAAKLGI